MAWVQYHPITPKSQNTGRPKNCSLNENGGRFQEAGKRGTERERGLHTSVRLKRRRRRSRPEGVELAHMPSSSEPVHKEQKEGAVLLRTLSWRSGRTEHTEAHDLKDAWSRLKPRAETDVACGFYKIET